MALSSISYAITIDTEVDEVSRPDIGLATDGFLRYITDRPGYDGEVPYPTWEVGPNNTDEWFEGFIIKDSLSSPNRRIDISKGGTYGTVSGFTFSIQNSMQLWKELQDLDITLINANIKLYCVLDNKFYDIWTGIIENDPFNETSMSIKCISHYRKVHKTLPPQQISPVVFPKAQKSSYGKAIPVCIGNIPYAKLFGVTGNSTRIVLDYASGKTHLGNNAILPEDILYSVACQGMLATGEFDIISVRKIYVVDELAGKYLSPISGTDAETEKLIRITSNDASFIFSGQYITRLYLSSLFDINATTFNNNYAYTGLMKASVGDTWWFEILDARSKHLVSNKEVYDFGLNEFHQLNLFNYDREKNEMQDAHGLVTEIVQEQNRDYVELLSTNITKDGTIKYMVTQGCEFKLIDNWANDELSNILPLGNQANGTDFDKTTETDEIDTLPIELSSANTPIDPYVHADRSLYVDLTRFDLRDSKEIYLGLDLNFIVGALQGSKNIGLGVEFYLIDIYERTHILTPDNMGVKYTLEKTIQNTGGVSETMYFNFLPIDYYKNGSLGAGDLGPNTDYGKLDNDGNTVQSYIKLPEDLQEMVSKGVAKAVLIRLKFSSTANVTITSVKIRQIGVFSFEETKTGSNKLFIKVEGEKKSEVPTFEQVNSVYKAFILMLEHYDNIDESNIDYGNLSYRRSFNIGWEIGRQITEQKNSLKYLQDLAQYSFIGIYQTRKGEIQLNAFRENTNIIHTFDETNIVRDSIKNFKKTSILDCYNDFKLFYAFNPGSNQFDRSLGITNVDQQIFPPFLNCMEGAPSEISSPNVFKVIANGDGSGTIIFVSDPSGELSVGDYITYFIEYGTSTVATSNYVYFARVTGVGAVTVSYADAIINNHTSIVDTITYIQLLKHQCGTPAWMQYVEGLNSYALSKQLWDICHNSYLNTKTIKNAPANIMKSFWFIDPSVFYDLDNTVCPINSAPYQYLQNLVEWTSRQKKQVTFSIPITLDTITIDLLQYISFSDSIYTNDTVLEGWVTKVSLNIKTSKFDIEVLLLPDNFETITRIIETGSAPDTITESGSQPDTITEIGTG